MNRASARPVGRAPLRARPVVRAPGLPARGNRIRRATAILTPVRAGAAFVIVLTTLAVYGVGASNAFTYRRLDFVAPASAYTTKDVVLQALGLDVGRPNLFLIRTDRYAARLEQLPAVTTADVTVELPDTLRVAIAERTPVVVWNVAGHRFLIDATGMAFAPAVSGGPGDGLPVILDKRSSSAGFDVGSHVDPVDLDASTRLASVTPKDIGSQASALRVEIDDDIGYVLQPIGVPWVAQFGVYTPSIRTPDLIPGQVRLLHSFLVGREQQVKTIRLADDRNGTYVER